MDVPNSTPIWPSAAGPKVPDFHTKPQKTDRLDMDSALAWLRRELAAMQLQDRNMHKQLLAMRSSISGLKDELNKERERWEMETQQEDRHDDKPTPGYVTKVEIIRNNNGPEDLRIYHAKQDSGILSDEERSDDEEIEESVQEMLQTFPPAVKPRSSSFLVTAKRSNSYHGRVVKLDERTEKEANKRKTRNGIRVRARSVAAIENDRLSSNSLSFSLRRPQSIADGMTSRFGSMPVINEIPGDALERNAFRSKTFALYGYRRGSGSADDSVRQSSFAAPNKLLAFGPLTRHSSMPVMYSGGRPKSGTEFRSSKGNRRLVQNNNEPLKRSISQIVLSRPALEKAKETKSNQMKHYRMYRSTSQISLV